LGGVLRDNIDTILEDPLQTAPFSLLALSFSRRPGYKAGFRSDKKKEAGAGDALCRSRFVKLKSFGLAESVGCDSEAKTVVRDVSETFSLVASDA
jgi:hypothetical protein